MPKAILIVESPTKAKTIAKILKGKMKVLSSRGHIKDLPKNDLGVDIDNSFEPNYVIIKEKNKIIQEIKREAKDADEIYLGCDPDREGEAIAFHIAEEIDGHMNIKRVLFYEITKDGIRKAFENPTLIDINKVNSHKARRVMDRLVGYLVSPLLWKVFKNYNLSAGRVQSVALRLIIEREREIEEFVPEEYWLIYGIFQTERGEEFRAQLRPKAEGERIKNMEGAKELEAVIRKPSEYLIGKIEMKKKYKSPLPPLITATLQQEAAKRFLFSGKKTMFIAQRLFEGVELAEETVGLITYPRTDSTRVAEEFLAKEREFIKENFGELYLPEKPRVYRDKKETQGAHEAIRPTDLKNLPEKIKEYLNKDEYNLYSIIFARAVAAQMTNSEYEELKVMIDIPGLEDFFFFCHSRKRIFDGFERVWPSGEKEIILPPLAEGEKIFLKDVILEQKFTQPPPRYTVASLIKKLETNGIGRPSTYAVIVDTLFERKYVIKQTGFLRPTELGRLVNDILIKNFANIFEVAFTREMEKELDLIETKDKNWPEVVKDFWIPFKEDLVRSENNISKMKEGIREELPEKCPLCGRSLAYRWGRYGKFISCSGYPECKYIKKEKPEILAETCPQCGRPLVKKQGKKGSFIGCTGYPECQFIKKEEATKLEEKCPECGKDLVEKAGRFGKFIACSGYPKCKYKKKNR